MCRLRMDILWNCQYDDLSIINEDYLVHPHRHGKILLSRQTNNFFNIADQLEALERQDHLFLIHGNSKTYKDAMTKSEGCDFLRYYTVKQKISQVRQSLPGPTGETNDLFYEPKGFCLYKSLELSCCNLYGTNCCCFNNW